jgi:hypothetical protein
MTELAILNMHLRERPVYRSELDTVNETHKIVAILSNQPELVEWNDELRGVLLWNAFKHAWSQLRFAGTTKEEVKNAVLAGKLTVLFDDEGNFVAGPGVLCERATATPLETRAKP